MELIKNIFSKDVMKNDSDRIESEARTWLVKIDRGLTDDEELAFLEWIEQNPANKTIFKELQEPWVMLDSMNQWKTDEIEPASDSFSKQIQQTKSLNGLIPWSIAATILLGLGLLWTAVSLSSSDQSYFLTNGPLNDIYERHVLEDLSVVEMREGALIEVIYTQEERKLILHEGEALFLVEKDPEREFIVQAGDFNVKAVGTAFNIALDNERVEVLVTHGIVQAEKRVKDLTPSSDLSEINELDEAIELTAGQRTIIDNNGSLFTVNITEPDYTEIADELSWREEVIEFVSTPLSDVVKEFNKRNYLQIIIVDRSLNRIRINAKLKTHNVDAFLEMLEYSADVAHERNKSGDVLIRSKLQ